MSSILSIDARSGAGDGWKVESTDEAELSFVVDRAVSASDWLTSRGREGRSHLLAVLADKLEEHSDELVELADTETALGIQRLRSELARASYQLRFMGQVAEEGSYLDASIEHATVTPLGNQPDLRRINVAIGPVAVFGSSNFPFAFSAPGGDTASALAAGCPVIVKAHGSHPHLSARVGEIFTEALRSEGAPAGVFQIVFGREAGIALVNHPDIRAVGFTGSLNGGRALFDQAAARPVPIPFYGELGSVNPFVVTAAAAAERGAAIATGLAASMTLGAGQFCTKPGLFLIPSGAAGDAVVSRLAAELALVNPSVLLNDSITAAFRSGVAQVLKLPEVRIRYKGQDKERKVAPVLVEVSADQFGGQPQQLLSDEYFGPFGVVVRWASLHEVSRILSELPPALTGTLHSGGTGDPELFAICQMLTNRSGRIVFDGYPTGLSVAWGMNHGGQYPASTSNSTSVGANSISRWLRPVSYQDAPESVLPIELRDGPSHPLPIRVDGKIHTPSSSHE
jgi:NADP-dependent aldehyde dehydrogenase